MPTELLPTPITDRRGRPPAIPTPIRTPEWAELVWRRAVELTEPGQPRDPGVNALDLLRAAHDDPATMAHALTLGRTHLRTEPADVVARAAAAILAVSITFLGVKPIAGDIARPATR